MPYYSEAISAPTNAESQHARANFLFCEVKISGFVADIFDDLLRLGIRFLRVSCSSSVHDGYDQPDIPKLLGRKCGLALITVRQLIFSSMMNRHTRSSRWKLRR